MNISIFNKQTVIAQLLKFCLVGAFNTGIHYGVFLALLRLFGVHYLISSAAGYSCGVVNSFIWNKLWTFQVRGTRKDIEFAKFVLVNIVSLLINLGALKGFVTIFGIRPEWGQVFAIGFAMVVNFLGNKFWTFRIREELNPEGLRKMSIKALK